MRRICGGTLIALLLTGGPPPFAQDDGPPSHFELEDPATRRASRAIHDVRRVELEARDGQLRGRVVMAQDLARGIFTCVHLVIDCDRNPLTGLAASYLVPVPRPGAGWDLAVRFTVGSRYRRNTPPASETDPLTPPMQLLSSGANVATRSETTGGGWRQNWRIGGYGVPPPVAEGNTISFGVPLGLLRECGLRYNDTIRLFFVVEGRIAEQPVSLDYSCHDEGIPIRMDGNPADWSGPARVVDRVDDLHPDAATVDLVDLRVEHAPETLFACLRLARPGFTLAHVDDIAYDDILDADETVVAVEPLGDGHYMEYRETTVSTWSGVSAHSRNAAVVGSGAIEYQFARPDAQTRFRVIAWTEARRFDHVPNRHDVQLRIPPEAWEGR